MNIQTAVRTVLSKYLVFQGRATRSEFWYWMLALVLVSIVLTLVDSVVLSPSLGFERFSPQAGQPLQTLFNLATLLDDSSLRVSGPARPDRPPQRALR